MPFTVEFNHTDKYEWASVIQVEKIDLGWPGAYAFRQRVTKAYIKSGFIAHVVPHTSLALNHNRIYVAYGVKKINQERFAIVMHESSTTLDNIDLHGVTRYMLDPGKNVIVSLDGNDIVISNLPESKLSITILPLSSKLVPSNVLVSFTHSCASLAGYGHSKSHDNAFYAAAAYIAAHVRMSNDNYGVSVTYTPWSGKPDDDIKMYENKHQPTNVKPSEGDFWFQFKDERSKDTQTKLSLPSPLKFSEYIDGIVMMLDGHNQPHFLHTLIEYENVTDDVRRMMLEQAERLEAIAQAYRLVANPLPEDE